MALLKFTYTSEAVNTNMEFYALIPQKNIYGPRIRRSLP